MDMGLHSSHLYKTPCRQALLLLPVLDSLGNLEYTHLWLHKGSLLCPKGSPQPPQFPKAYCCLDSHTALVFPLTGKQHFCSASVAP